VIVACMPKSGSTLLTALIASLPGMRRSTLVPGYHRREQEICIHSMKAAEEKMRAQREAFNSTRGVQSKMPIGFASQMHLRYSQPTATIMAEYNIKPVVLVRNIFDIVVSLADHIRNESPLMAMAYVTEAMRTWSAEELHEFIGDMVIPWYMNFFVSWQDCEDKLLVTYEELTGDPKKILQQVSLFANIPASERYIENAIARANIKNTRKNVATAGRGQKLADRVKDKIRKAAAYYPNIDFSPIGLQAVRSEQKAESLLNS
jgi:Sulfotransferase domain